jgi:hypothetical protein
MSLVNLLSLSGRFILKLNKAIYFARYFVDYQHLGFIGDGLSLM